MSIKRHVPAGYADFLFPILLLRVANLMGQNGFMHGHFHNSEHLLYASEKILFEKNPIGILLSF